MMEGTINSVSIQSLILGVIMISYVSSKTQEEPLLYLFMMFKFCLIWLIITSILGSIAYAMQYLKYGKVVVDPSPRTRAWFEGPHLSAAMRATMEVSSLICSFLQLLPEYNNLIENGIGYFNLLVLLISLWIIILIGELFQNGHSANAA